MFKEKKSFLPFAIFSSIIATFFLFQFAFAYTCPNYLFSTDLRKGDTSNDVKVIQEILNLDKRTLVASVGPGSPGKETLVFGVATREALKRFQALFIEYIGVADGKFTSRTRTSMNAVCKGPFFTGSSTSPYDIEDKKDEAPLVVAVAGPTTADINTPFRAFIGGNVAIKSPALTGLIISNATAGDVRKTSSTTYSFLVTPNKDANDDISLQFEAESIESVKGQKNVNASNEWIVKLTGTVASDSDETDPLANIDIPNIDIPLPPGTDCSQVTSVDISDYNNPCYGKSPMSNNGSNLTNGDQGGGGGGGFDPSQIMQMLSGMLGQLGKGGGGGDKGGGDEKGDKEDVGDEKEDPSKKGGAGDAGKGKEGGDDQGGMGSVPAPCACVKAHKTIHLAPYGGLGVPGYYEMSANPGAGFYTGKTIPGPQTCGEKLYTSVIKCQAGCDGQCTGTCCNLYKNILGEDVIGKIPPAPTFKWEGPAGGG